MRRTHASFFGHGAKRRGGQGEINATAVFGFADSIDTDDGGKNAIGAIVRAGGAAFGEVGERGSGDGDEFFAGVRDGFGEIAVHRSLIKSRYDCCFHWFPPSVGVDSERRGESLNRLNSFFHFNPDCILVLLVNHNEIELMPFSSSKN